MAAFDFDVEVSGFEPLAEFFAGWEPKAVDRRMKRALGKGARVQAAAIRAEAPLGPSGNLRHAVRSRTLRDRAGKGPAAVAGVRRRRGPRIQLKAAQGLRRQDWAPHAGLVEGGHRIVTRKGHDTGRRTRPNPFALRGAMRSQSSAERVVQEELERDF